MSKEAWRRQLADCCAAAEAAASRWPVAEHVAGIGRLRRVVEAV